MVLLNYDEKIKEIENNLESWSKKILTPLGNITVVKSLSLCYLNWWYTYFFRNLRHPKKPLVDLKKCFTTLVGVEKTTKLRDLS